MPLSWAIKVRKAWELLSLLCIFPQTGQKFRTSQSFLAFNLAFSRSRFLPVPCRPRLVASPFSEPLSATDHHIPLWILTPVWCMLFSALSRPARTQTADQSGLSLLRSADRLAIYRVSRRCAHESDFLFFSFLSKVFCGSFNDWMRKRKLSIYISCFRRQPDQWVVLHMLEGGQMCVAQGARLKTHAHSNPWKRYRTSLHVCLSCHIGVSGPAAAQTTHHVWFISTCLQNNKTWQFDSEPIAALQTS